MSLFILHSISRLLFITFTVKVDFFFLFTITFLRRTENYVTTVVVTVSVRRCVSVRWFFSHRLKVRTAVAQAFKQTLVSFTFKTHTRVNCNVGFTDCQHTYFPYFMWTNAATEPPVIDQTAGEQRKIKRFSSCIMWQAPVKFSKCWSMTLSQCGSAVYSAGHRWGRVTQLLVAVIVVFLPVLFVRFWQREVTADKCGSETVTSSGRAVAEAVWEWVSRVFFFFSGFFLHQHVCGKRSGGCCCKHSFMRRVRLVSRVCCEAAESLREHGYQPTLCCFCGSHV